ncbi:hypothetical protein GTG23_00325 [Rhodococcus hoagii]|nr:hypothetical protein [Prescottella equi]
MSEPTTYQPKTASRVQAMRFTGDNANQIAEWWGDPWVVDSGGKYSDTCDFLYVNEDEDDELEVRRGDWLVLLGGTFIRLSDDEFRNQYEETR